MASSSFGNASSATPTIIAPPPAPAPNQPPPPAAPAAAPAPVAPPKPVEEPIPESVEEFDAFVNSTVKKYFTVSEEIGGAVGKQVCSVFINILAALADPE